MNYSVASDPLGRSYAKLARVDCRSLLATRFSLRGVSSPPLRFGASTRSKNDSLLCNCRSRAAECVRANGFARGVARGPTGSAHVGAGDDSRQLSLPMPPLLLALGSVSGSELGGSELLAAALSLG